MTAQSTISLIMNVSASVSYGIEKYQVSARSNFWKVHKTALIILSVFGYVIMTIGLVRLTMTRSSLHMIPIFLGASIITATISGGYLYYQGKKGTVITKVRTVPLKTLNYPKIEGTHQTFWPSRHWSQDRELAPPAEICVMIFQELNRHEIKAVMQTCKTWFRFIMDTKELNRDFFGGFSYNFPLKKQMPSWLSGIMKTVPFLEETQAKLPFAEPSSEDVEKCNDFYTAEGKIDFFKIQHHFKNPNSPTLVCAQDKHGRWYIFARAQVRSCQFLSDESDLEEKFSVNSFAKEAALTLFQEYTNDDTWYLKIVIPSVNNQNCAERLQRLNENEFHALIEGKIVPFHLETESSMIVFHLTLLQLQDEFQMSVNEGDLYTSSEDDSGEEYSSDDLEFSGTLNNNRYNNANFTHGVIIDSI